MCEGRGLILHHFCAFGDIRGQAAIAVAHRFEQTHGHALKVAWQHIDIRVAVQLLQHTPLHEAGQYNARVLRRHLLDLLTVFHRIGGATGNDQLLIRIELAECVDQIVHAFFGNNTAKEQNVIILVQTIFAGNLLCRKQLFAFHAVGDELGFAPIRILEVFLHVPAEHYHLVRALSRGTFAEFQICRGKSAPFSTLPVKTMNCSDSADARPMSQSKHHAGTFRAVVDHVGLCSYCPQRREKRGR